MITNYTLDDYKELLLIENYCARTVDSSATSAAILEQIGTVVTNEDENIKFSFKQFAFTEIIENGKTSVRVSMFKNVYCLELLLHFDIKCSLRLGTFPGCPSASRLQSPPESRLSRQSGVVASSNFDWSATWVIETEMTADEAIKLTQDGILLNEKDETLLDTETIHSQLPVWNGTDNRAGNIFATETLAAIMLISSLF